MRQAKRRSDCPINFALETFGDKWSLLIVRDLMFKGKARYGDFLGSEEKIATNILADRLAALERSGIIKKTRDEKSRARNAYSLTKKGLDLAPTLIELILWSAKYDPRTAAPKEFVKAARTNKERVIAKIETDITGTKRR